jgi:NAD(P)-dependent dehydrogenase (short-subunit alcohol dehydrogenase family)
VADVALVCGAGGALGGALVEAFLERGDAVVAADRSASPRTDAARVEAVDLSSPDEVEALWERLAADGALPRWVVNAVGAFRGGTVAESEPDGYGLMHDVNLATAWWSCRAAARRMQAGGAIVNVAARAAVTEGSTSAAYTVAKAGVVRLTQVLADELRERHVRANAILPSLIDTPANRAAMPADALRGAVPPAQIAVVVTFLCSDAAAAISGAAVPVYGDA